MTEPRPRPPRSEPREIAELRQLGARHPELAEAVSLQLELVSLQRRVQARVPTRWVEVAPDWLRQRQEAGHPLLQFGDIPLDWTDFRLVFRQTADLLRRFDTLEPAHCQALHALSRDGHALEPLVVRWFDSSLTPDGAPGELLGGDDALQAALDQVLTLAMRPFLERCAEIVQQRADFSAWTHPHCPLCGGEPEFAVLTTAGDRLLTCGRCTARWRFDSAACPFCGNTDRGRLPSFGSPDGLYRLYACDACRRYLKAYDASRGGRPLLLSVDTIATLPLDAAAIQRGYR